MFGGERLRHYSLRGLSSVQCWILAAAIEDKVWCLVSSRQRERPGRSQSRSGGWRERSRRFYLTLGREIRERGETGALSLLSWTSSQVSLVVRSLDHSAPQKQSPAWTLFREFSDLEIFLVKWSEGRGGVYICCCQLLIDYWFGVFWWRYWLCVHNRRKNKLHRVVSSSECSAGQRLDRIQKFKNKKMMINSWDLWSGVLYNLFINDKYCTY